MNKTKKNGKQPDATDPLAKPLMDESFTVQLTTEQKRRLVTAANAKSLSLAAWARMSLLEKAAEAEQ